MGLIFLVTGKERLRVRPADVDRAPVVGRAWVEAVGTATGGETAAREQLRPVGARDRFAWGRCGEETTRAWSGTEGWRVVH